MTPADFFDLTNVILYGTKHLFTSLCAFVHSSHPISEHRKGHKLIQGPIAQFKLDKRNMPPFCPLLLLLFITHPCLFTQTSLQAVINTR